MSPLAWIVAGALGMSAIALVGLVTLLLNESQLKRVILPLVAFAAGSLLGGAFLHLLPEAMAAGGVQADTFLPVLIGFALFFLLEQYLSWHRTHAPVAAQKASVTYLILLADGVHNFVGGLAIGASFWYLPRLASLPGSRPLPTWISSQRSSMTTCCATT